DAGEGAVGPEGEAETVFAARSSYWTTPRTAAAGDHVGGGCRRCNRVECGRRRDPLCFIHGGGGTAQTSLTHEFDERIAETRWIAGQFADLTCERFAALIVRE